MAHTEETKQKIRDAWKIRKLTFVPPLKGKHHTAETRRKISEKVRAAPPSHLGHAHSIESRRKMSETKRARGSAVSGEAHYAFKDGKLAERRGQRFSAEYKRWRYDVFMRDNFTCCECGDNKGGNLNAHHIKPFADFPELRFDVSNGITLCESCHTNLHDVPDSTRKQTRAKRAIE